MRHARFLRLFFWIALASCASAQPPPPGQALFQRNCANCHSAAAQVNNGGAPDVAALNAMSTESIFDSLMKGKMKDNAASLTSRERRNIAEFLGKRAYH